MSTYTPEKLMLKVLRDNIPLTHSTAVNTKYLLEELSDIISFSGWIEHLGTVGRFSIFCLCLKTLPSALKPHIMILVV